MENKTGKYFKYAIGEIILVVIGILIALQINNWNQNRLNRIGAKNFLNQVQEELELDVINYKRDLDNIQRYTNYLNKVSERKYSEIDLSLLPSSLTRNLSPNNNNTSYIKMLESGIIEYVDNNIIKKNLKKYYLTDYVNYNNLTAFHLKFVLENIEGPSLEILKYKRGFRVEPNQVIEKLEDGKLESMINWQISFLENYVPLINENRIQAKKLISLIEKK
ncbi:MAG: hypothetical protein JXQ93_11525 [Flavobacteriaceae bacterium]